MPEFALDADQFVPLRRALAPGEGADFQLPRVRRYSEVRDEGVFGFTGSGGDHGFPACLLRKRDGGQSLGDRANLV